VTKVWGIYMAKNRSLGVVLIILGVLVNNYAYVTDIVGNSHEGLIYMGSRGIAAAVLGLLAIALGVVALLRASRPDDA
tara:strand:- start:1928 stop:2161 length:234 start_codon:yes stop_codon:yes gene_type:complete